MNTTQILEDVVNNFESSVTGGPAAAAEIPAGSPPKANASRGRPMQKKRFVMGLTLSSGGIAMMLTVAAGLHRAFGADGALSLPAVGCCMIVALMMIGGGFGVMATAAPTFDDDEFERLMQGGSVRSESDEVG